MPPSTVQVASVEPAAIEVGARPILTLTSALEGRPLRSHHTAIAFTTASSGCPPASLRGVTRLLYEGTSATNDSVTVQLGSAFGPSDAGEFAVCLTYTLAADVVVDPAAVQAATWVRMAAPPVYVHPPPAPAPTAITSVAPLQFALDAAPYVQLGVTSAFVPSNATVWALAPNATACTQGPRFWRTAVPAGSGTAFAAGPMLPEGAESPRPVPAAPLVACLSYDAGGTFVAQPSAVVVVAAAEPSAGAVVAVAPTVLTAGVVDTPLALTVAAAAAPLPAAARYALVPQAALTGDSAPCGNASVRVAETELDAEHLGSAVPTPGVYAVCLQPSPAAEWTLQTTSGVTVTVRAAAATPTAIVALTPRTGSMSTAWTVTLDGAVPSPSTLIAFVLLEEDDADGDCAAAAAASQLVAVTPILDATAAADAGAVTVALSEPFPVTGRYRLCYTTDGVPGPWAAQALGTTSVTVEPPAATPTTVVALMPSRLAQTAADAEVDMVGAVPSATTLVAFVALPAGSEAACAVGPRVGVRPVRGNTTVVDVAMTELPTSGVYAVCYSADNGTTWVLQTSVALEVRPPPLTSHTVTAVAPSTVPARVPNVTVALDGLVPSPWTWLALSATSDCAVGAVVAPTAVPAPGSVTLEAALEVAGVLSLCASVDAGASWVLQVDVALEARPPAPTASSVRALVPSVLSRPASSDGDAVPVAADGPLPSPWSRLGAAAADAAGIDVRWTDPIRRALARAEPSTEPRSRSRAGVVCLAGVRERRPVAGRAARSQRWSRPRARRAARKCAARPPRRVLQHQQRHDVGAPNRRRASRVAAEPARCHRHRGARGRIDLRGRRWRRAPSAGERARRRRAGRRLRRRGGRRAAVAAVRPAAGGSREQRPRLPVCAPRGRGGAADGV